MSDLVGLTLPKQERLLQVFALHSGSTETVAELAPLADLEQSEAELAFRDPAFLARAQAAAARADATGKVAVVLARKAELNLMQRVLAASKDVDITDVPELAKIVSRVIERDDRVRMAERQTDNIPLIHITFGSDMAMKTEILQPAKKSAEVEDVVPKRVTGQATPLDGLDLIDVFSLPVVPLDVNGGGNGHD